MVRVEDSFAAGAGAEIYEESPGCECSSGDGVVRDGEEVRFVICRKRKRKVLVSKVGNFGKVCAKR